MDTGWLVRLTRFSLIGACLFRTDKNSVFHVAKFIFESVCVHLKFSISIFSSSRKSGLSKFVNDLYLIEL